ncbi:response regulator [Bradyrhizobium canariense]|uniref:response regulator n=1 Tax=Bradyrhizobium canariense TaxID=255045 RepID=UPI00269AAD0E
MPDAVRHWSSVRSIKGRAGWQVVAEAHEGKEAVAEAVERRPDVAIVDYSMMLMTGLEVTRCIRGHQLVNTHFYDA